MEISEKFRKKLLNDLFLNIDQTNWLTHFYRYMIDSKYRTTERLDRFFSKQLKDPHWNLIDIAKTFKGPTYNHIILNILRYVHKEIMYETDATNWGKVEFWASAYETLTKKIDDCDGLNSLIYVLARLAGIPEYMLYACIGDTSAGGHFWLLYLSPRVGNLFSIDATFYPDFTEIKYRKPFNIGDKYKNIWYIFNENIVMKPR